MSLPNTNNMLVNYLKNVALILLQSKTMLPFCSVETISVCELV
jgi:hypothetical protein